MDTTQPTYRVAAVQMEPKLGRLEANLERILDATRRGGRRRARAWSSSRSALCRATAFQSARKGWRTPSRSIATPVRRVVAACRQHRVLLRFRPAGARRHAAVQRLRADRSRRAWSAPTARSICRSWGSTCSPTPATGRSRSTTRAGSGSACTSATTAAFPRPARVLSLLGADLLVLPTNWPTHSECAAEHMIPTRAMENTVYVMAVNRVGEESGFRFIGASSIVDPSGRRAGQGGGPDSEEVLSPRSTRAGAARSTWCACPGGTRSTGSPTAGRGSTRSWSRPTGVTDRNRRNRRQRPIGIASRAGPRECGREAEAAAGRAWPSSAQLAGGWLDPCGWLRLREVCAWAWAAWDRPGWSTLD